MALEPTHDRPAVVTLGLGELMESYLPAYGDTWARAQDQLLEDPWERGRVLELADDLLERGQLHPVLVHTGGCDPDHLGDLCTGDPGCCPPRLINGMHRVLAHVLTCRPTIAVATRPGGEDEQTWEARFTLTRPLTDEQWDALTSLLSFRLDPDTWLEGCGLGGQGSQYDLWFYGLTGDRLGAASIAVRSRLARAGVAVSDLSWHRVED